MLQDCEVDQTLHAEVYASACMHTPTAGCCSITSYVMRQLHVVGGQWLTAEAINMSMLCSSVQVSLTIPTSCQRFSGSLPSWQVKAVHSDSYRDEAHAEPAATTPLFHADPSNAEAAGHS